MIASAPMLCYLIAGLTVLAGFVCRVAQVGPPVGIWLACFLIAFGAAKALVAQGRLRALGRVAQGGPDPRADFAGPFIFWVYIGGKFLVWAVAWTVAWHLLGHPQAIR